MAKVKRNRFLLDLNYVEYVLLSINVIKINFEKLLVKMYI